MTMKIQYMKICGMWVKQHLGLNVPQRLRSRRRPGAQCSNIYGQALGEWWHHQALMSAMDCSMLVTGWLWRWQEPRGEPPGEAAGGGACQGMVHPVSWTSPCFLSMLRLKRLVCHVPWPAVLILHDHMAMDGRLKLWDKYIAFLP